MADAATWKKRVAAWRASGKTAAEYCEEHRLGMSSLRYWSHQIRRDASAPVLTPSSTVRLARVERVATEPPARPPTSPAVAIEIGSARVRVKRGVDAGTVATVLVQIADADHVFFEYLPRETSAAIGELFRGFTGYVQADAKSVYDLLFTPPAQRPPPDDGEPDLGERHEVGCWSHCRRKLWETAITSKDPVAREAVLRIKRIFDLDRSWRSKSPDEIRSLREQHLRRGMLRSALGYAHRQRGPLTRFFDDGRLALTNNQSERELRRVAVGRKAWLFVGSDDHAQAAGNLLTLIASARLHRLDPEAYLRDLLRVVPHWPRDRYLELAPRYWLATRARLDAAQLERELGPLDIPAPAASAEQPAAG